MISLQYPLMRQIWIVAILFAASACAQDLSQIKIEKVAGAMKFTEGPVWSREGYLLFSDIPSNES